MQCEEFLDGYSEFLDGRLDDEAQGAFEAHLRGCEACARYDRVIQRGLFIYRNLPDVESSPDFFPRLRHRLYHVDDGDRLATRSPLGSAAVVAMAAVGLLALAWLPFATRISVEVSLPPVAVEAPPPRPQAAPSLFDAGPFLTPVRGVSPRPAPAAMPTGPELFEAFLEASAVPYAPRGQRLLTSLRH